ncbi:CIC11C00000004480 [Sungouiella intermedia]|uniref:CIC11C00000004480 n=1 Tax=Sungouiella intermedia TaxID=45354 RepID=A0A1L0C6V5_9ASCO|nr:CIC11C00000004480 [[Candida] intermedia]
MVSSIDLKALNVFTLSTVTQDMIHKLVVKTLQVIPCLEDKNKKTTSEGKPLPSLMTFINRLVRYTNVYTGTLMTTLVYLERLKQKLPKNAQGLPCTRHRIFLSCLILASKFHNDSSPKNIHWANYTEGLFSITDVNLMERQLLYLLNWDLRVSNEEMVSHLGKFLDPIKEDLIRSSKMRQYLQKQQQAVAAQLQAEKELLATPSISRSSSTSSALSLGHMPSHSRASSMASCHYRQDSTSSVESLSPVMTKRWTNGVDPRIEMAAQNEEKELTRMLDHLCKGSN